MGGSGGHMRHPHDLDEIENGQDLIALFRAIPNYLRSEEFQGGGTSSLKLDGSNNALKVIRRGKDLEFAVDRGGKGSSARTALDVRGVTVDLLNDRFPNNPGLAGSSAGLIEMMNQAYQANPEKMKDLLQKLGLVGEKGEPDSTKFINIEYIERNAGDIKRYVQDYIQKYGEKPKIIKGRANAIWYTFDSITFLNISQYYENIAVKSKKDPITGKSIKGPDGKVIRYKEKVRPGAQRPMKTVLDDDGKEIQVIEDDVSVPVKFDKKDLDQLAKLAQPFAPDANGKQMTVQGPGQLGIRVDYEAETGEDATEDEIQAATEIAITRLENNVERALGMPLTINISRERSETRTLVQWLSIANNVPYKPYITITPAGQELANLKTNKISPFAKEVHKQLIVRGVPVFTFISTTDMDGNPTCDTKLSSGPGNETDCEKAIYGAIFYEAARILGKVVQQSLTANADEFGNTVDHEGIVINAGMPFGDKTTGHTFKLTGEFIVSGNLGVYAQRESLVRRLNEEETVELDIVDAEHVDGISGNTSGGKTYALVPGSMKPPTLGHAGMIEAYSNTPGVDEVLVFVSSPELYVRDKKTGEYVHDKKTGKLKINKSIRTFPGRPEGVTQEEASDILKMMLPRELLKPEGNVEIIQTSHPSPMSAVYDFVSPEDKDVRQAQPGDIAILGASTKGGDAKRWDSLVKNADTQVRPGVEVRNEPVDPTIHGPEYVDLIKSDEAKEILVELPTIVKAKEKGKKPDLSAISAGDARHIMGFLDTDKKEMALQLLNAFFGDATAAVIARLELPGGVEAPIEETSGMAMGSVAMASGNIDSDVRDPLVGRSRSTRGKRAKKKKAKNENIDMSLVNEVYELLIERGIKL